MVNNRTKRLTENENWYPPTEKKSNCEPVSHPLPGVQLTQIPTRPRSDHAENTQGQEHTRSWNQREPIPHRPTYGHTDWRPCQQDQWSLGQLKLRSREVKDIKPEIVLPSFLTIDASSYIHFAHSLKGTCSAKRVIFDCVFAIS